MHRLLRKVAVVTGAAGGLGSAIVRAFADEGAIVIATDIDSARGGALARQVGVRASFRPLDVTDESGWSDTVDHAINAHGRIDILVNNAAVLYVGPLLDTPAAEYRRVIEINQTGSFLGMQIVGRAMVTQGRGSIINIGSVDATQGTPGVVAYAASKWAMRGMTRVAAVELGSRGVRVNSILPGGIRGNMAKPAINTAMGVKPASEIIGGWPLGRMCDPAEIVPLAVYLASDESAYCTGSEFVIDGGATAGPHYLSRR